MNVKLTDFVDVARVKPEGDVRFAEDSGNRQLINKGTFGHRVSTWLRSSSLVRGFKELFGWQDTRADRQQAAFTAFRAAMREEFNSRAAPGGVADQAIADVGIHAGAMRGDQILAAITRARDLVAQNNARRAEQAAEFAAGQPAFARLCTEHTPHIVPRNFPPAAQLEYQQRLAENLAEKSQRGQTVLTATEVEQTARETLREVVALGAGPDGPAGLQRVIASQRALTDSYVALVRAVAEDADAATTARMLGETMSLVPAVKAADWTAASDPFAGTKATDRCIRRALGELHAGGRGVVGVAQTKALERDAPLRAVTAAATHIVMSDDGDGHPPALRLLANGVSDQAKHLIVGMTQLLGPRTGVNSYADVDTYDLTRFAISPTAFESGRQALGPVLPTIRVPAA
jgi:hypothetical protein